MTELKSSESRSGGLDEMCERGCGVLHCGWREEMSLKAILVVAVIL